MRNNIFRSQPKKTKIFKKGSVDGWKQIEECHLRDEVLRKRGHGPRSELVRHAIDLDQFAQMHARCAKMAFSEKTICKMILFMAHSIQMKIDLTDKFQSQWHMFMSYCRQFQEHCHGHVVCANVQVTIATLEYQAAFHGIYHEQLLNKNWQLTIKNFEYKKNELQTIIRYFSVWRKERYLVEEMNGVPRKESIKYYSADTRYNNLRILVAAFFAYADGVMRHFGFDDFFVSALHSSQSSIKALFLWMSKMGKDTTNLYAGGIAQQNYIDNQKQNTKSFNINQKVGSSSYLEEDMLEEIGVNQSARGIGSSSVQIQRTSGQSMIEKYNLRDQKKTGMASYILPRNFVHWGLAFGQLLYKRFMELKLPNSYDYQGFCINIKKFGGCYMLSRESTNQEWFHNLILPQNKRSVDEMCAEITAIIFYLLEETLKDRMPSFESTVLTFLQNNQLKSRLDLFNLMSESPICYEVLVDFLKYTFSDKWLPSVISDYIQSYIQSSIKEVDHRTTQSRVEIIDEGEVNRCVGWGLMCAIQKYEKRHKNESDNGESKNVLRILEKYEGTRR